MADIFYPKFNDAPTMIIIEGIPNENLVSYIEELRKQEDEEYDFDVHSKDGKTWIHFLSIGIPPYKWLNDIAVSHSSGERKFNLVMALYDLGMEMYDVSTIEVSGSYETRSRLQETRIEYTEDEEALQKAEDESRNPPPAGKFLKFLEKYGLLKEYLA